MHSMSALQPKWIWYFHGLIIEISRFKLLSSIWSSLDGLVRLRSYQVLDRPGKTAKHFLANGVASHELLIDALRSGDPDRAGEAGRQHVLEVPRMLAEGRAKRKR